MEFFSMMIILLILITLSLDNVWKMLGENCCWSLLGLKRLRLMPRKEDPLQGGKFSPR